MQICGVGAAVPDGAVTNEELESRLALEPGWIARRTGVFCRPTVCPNEATSDLAIAAGDAALIAAGSTRTEVGLVLLATSTPDHPLPPTAPLVASKLGLSEAGAIDLAGACSGFLYALVLASAYCNFVQRPCLVIGANVLSRRVNKMDRNTVSLFSDGAGAVVMNPAREESLLGHQFTSDGSLYSTIVVRAGGTREPITPEAIADGRHFMSMENGPGVFKRGVDMMTRAGLTALANSGLEPCTVDWLIPHQANVRMIDETARRLGIAGDRTISVVDRIGNSSAATIPVALALACNEDKIQRGHIVLLTAVGAGMLSAGVVLRW